MNDHCDEHEPADSLRHPPGTLASGLRPSAGSIGGRNTRLTSALNQSGRWRHLPWKGTVSIRPMGLGARELARHALMEQ